MGPAPAARAVPYPLESANEARRSQTTNPVTQMRYRRPSRRVPTHPPEGRPFRAGILIQVRLAASSYLIRIDTYGCAPVWVRINAHPRELVSQGLRWADWKSQEKSRTTRGPVVVPRTRVPRRLCSDPITRQAYRGKGACWAAFGAQGQMDLDRPWAEDRPRATFQTTVATIERGPHSVSRYPPSRADSSLRLDDCLPARGGGKAGIDVEPQRPCLFGRLVPQGGPGTRMPACQRKRPQDRRAWGGPSGAAPRTGREGTRRDGGHSLLVTRSGRTPWGPAARRGRTARAGAP